MEERMSVCESNVIAINETFLSAQQNITEMIQKTVQEIEIKLKTYGIQPKQDSKVIILIRFFTTYVIDFSRFYTQTTLLEDCDQRKSASKNSTLLSNS